MRPPEGDPSRQVGSVRGRVESAADTLVPRRFRAYREQILYLAVGAWNTPFGYLNFVILYHSLNTRLPVTVILAPATHCRLSTRTSATATSCSVAGAACCVRSPVHVRLPGRARRQPRGPPARAVLAPVERVRGPGLVHACRGRVELPGPQALQLPARAGERSDARNYSARPTRGRKVSVRCRS